jgi:hypothetical protein
MAFNAFLVSALSEGATGEAAPALLTKFNMV